MALSRIRTMTSRLGSSLAILASLGLPVVVHAADQQDPAVVQAHAEQFLKKQTAGLPGKVTIQVAAPRAALPACSAFDAFQPTGSRSMGKTTIGVRCLAPSRWTVYLGAQIRVLGSYVVTREPLPANHVLSAADLTLREGDLGSLPADVVTNADDLQGYRTVSGLAAGAPLRNALLRAPLAVQQGQVTRLVLSGPGFSIQSEGQALANAGRGDRVRVKTASGEVVSGVAHDGQQVVVAF
jgi:flagella basal body P-ring formation protein FlgA